MRFQLDKQYMESKIEDAVRGKAAELFDFFLFLK